MSTLIWLAASSLIWGAGLCAGALALQTLNDLSGRARQWIWRGASLLLIAPWIAAPVVGLLGLGQGSFEAVPAVFPVDGEAIEFAEVALAPAIMTGLAVGADPAFTFSQIAWTELAVIVVLGGWIVRFVAAQFAARSLGGILSSARKAGVGAARQALTGWSARLGLRRMPELLIASTGVSPFSFGVLRPVICLPEGLEQRLSREALDLVVGHECLHIARGDGWLRPLERIPADVFWFNPFAWIMRRELDLARELACDEGVVEVSAARRAYARTLRDVAGLAAGLPAALPAASMSLVGGGRNLVMRMKRTLAQARRKPARWALVSAIALGALGLPAALGQGVLATPRATALPASPSPVSPPPVMPQVVMPQVVSGYLRQPGETQLAVVPVLPQAQSMQLAQAQQPPQPHQPPQPIQPLDPLNGKPGPLVLAPGSLAPLLLPELVPQDRIDKPFVHNFLAGRGLVEMDGRFLSDLLKDGGARGAYELAVRDHFARNGGGKDKPVRADFFKPDAMPMQAPFRARVEAIKPAQMGVGAVTLTQTHDEGMTKGCTAEVQMLREIKVKEGQVLAKDEVIGIGDSAAYVIFRCQSLQLEGKVLAGESSRKVDVWYYSSRAGKPFVVAAPMLLSPRETALKLVTPNAAGLAAAYRAVGLGWSIPAKAGSTLHAPFPAKVTQAEERGEGFALTIEQTQASDGGCKFQFTGLGELKVSQGDTIKKSDAIAIVGERTRTSITCQGVGAWSGVWLDKRSSPVIVLPKTSWSSDAFGKLIERRAAPKRPPAARAEPAPMIAPRSRSGVTVLTPIQLPAPQTPVQRTDGRPKLEGATWPIVEAPAWLTSGFGQRLDVLTNKHAFHPGIDIAKEFEAPVHAPGPGTILKAGGDSLLGNVVELSMAGGYVLRFGHLNDIRVRTGDVVKAGDVVGAMGSSGRSTGPHLHLETLWNGKNYDPEAIEGLMLGARLMLPPNRQAPAPPLPEPARASAPFRLIAPNNPVLDGSREIVSGYGYRSDPFTNKSAFHEGIDIAAPLRAVVRTPAAGTVLFADMRGTSGKVAELQLDGPNKVRFAHLDEIRVKAGDILKAGAVIGTVGTTGRTSTATGPHLHFEIFWNGKSYDPQTVDGLVLTGAR